MITTKFPACCGVCAELGGVDGGMMTGLGTTRACSELSDRHLSDQVRLDDGGRIGGR